MIKRALACSRRSSARASSDYLASMTRPDRLRGGNRSGLSCTERSRCFGRTNRLLLSQTWRSCPLQWMRRNGAGRQNRVRIHRHHPNLSGAPPDKQTLRSALYAKAPVVIADAEGRRGARSVLPGRFPSYSGSGLVMDELQQAASFVPSKR